MILSREDAEMTLNRRTFLASGVASAALASPLEAAAPKLGVNFGGFHRVTLGDFAITTLAGGARVVDKLQKIFGMNVSAEEFAAASSMANIPADCTRFYFTPVLMNTGSKLVLFDAGLNGQATLAQIEVAGYTADQIDKVIITHMHGDHIGGLMGDAGETFVGAEYALGLLRIIYGPAATTRTTKPRYCHWPKSSLLSLMARLWPLVHSHGCERAQAGTYGLHA